ncbi:hypothetical protein NOCD_16175 [Nocardioides cavernae]|jgi:hypothetical protein|uniref:hypothetical protein n=1 Tax=Nocardioides TaxID=1839 RepID=UPI0009EAE475|nr:MULTISPECIES: hypothetical protein [Nocardioides]MCK9825021.1 hypothetical protein [Nocardioides cavernae]
MTDLHGVRPVDVARFALGATALLRPQWLLRSTASADGTGPRRVTRILGGRYVLQSVAGLAPSRTWVPEVDAAIDLVHAVSTVGLARSFPDHRRLALASGAVALVFAVADLTDVRVA